MNSNRIHEIEDDELRRKVFAKILDIVYNEGNKIRGKAEWII